MKTDKQSKVMRHTVCRFFGQSFFGTALFSIFACHHAFAEDIATANVEKQILLAEKQIQDAKKSLTDIGIEQQEIEEIKPPPPPPKTPQELIAKYIPTYEFDAESGTDFMKKVNASTWRKGMKRNQYTTVKLQVMLDWSHASPGPIDSGWGKNSRKAILAFEKMHGLKADGRMDGKVWNLLNRGERKDRPALVTYTITKQDVKTRFRRTPKGYAAKARDWELSYQNIYEMLAERFHMNINFLKRLNKGIKFRAGKKITVVNVGRHNARVVDKVLVDKRKNILYAYSDDKIVATYPTTIGARTPSSRRSYTMVGKVFMPTYKAQTKAKRYILPPGPNNPVGVAWMALSKPTFGIHGSPQPEGISRQRSHGCVRLTNWDASELFATIKKGARVNFK